MSSARRPTGAFLLFPIVHIIIGDPVFSSLRSLKGIYFFFMLYNSLLLRIDSSSHLSKLFSLLLHMLLKQGKPANKILFQSCLFIKLFKGTSAPKFIYQAVRNLLPLLELRSSGSLSRSRRLSKPKPVPLLPRRSFFLAVRWLLQGASQRSERSFSLRLYRELSDAYDKKGFAFKKKIEWHSRCYSGFLKSSSLQSSDRKPLSSKSSSSLPSGLPHDSRRSSFK